MGVMNLINVKISRSLTNKLGIKVDTCLTRDSETSEKYKWQTNILNLQKG